MPWVMKDERPLFGDLQVLQELGEVLAAGNHGHAEGAGELVQGDIVQEHGPGLGVLDPRQGCTGRWGRLWVRREALGTTTASTQPALPPWGLAVGLRRVLEIPPAEESGHGHGLAEGEVPHRRGPQLACRCGGSARARVSLSTGAKLAPVRSRAFRPR